MGPSKRSGASHAGVVDTSSQGSNLLALHRSKFWDWTPSTVVAISGCPGAPLAAVGYETGDLELWDLSNMTCINRIPGDGVEVTALAWAKDSLDGTWRTFCATLDGSLAEVLWAQSKLVASTDSGAGAIWSLAAQPADSVQPGFAHPIAAACDDGSVRLFAVEAGEPGAHYERSLARLQGRVLAVAWHPSGTALVAGGVDGCIHALDLGTGMETMRITASASTRRPVCVWRLAVLADGTIASGDSDGAVCMWDGRYGAQLHRFVQHSADVLALAATPDGEYLFASGVDPRVAQFRKVTGQGAGGQGQQQQGASNTGAGQWVFTHHKRPHTHDVRAMGLVPLGGGRQVLLTGGVDAQLIAYTVPAFLQDHPVRLSKCPQRPLVQLAPGPASFLQQQQQASQPGEDAPQDAAAGAAPPAKKARGASGAAVAAAGGAATPAPRLLCAQHDTLDVWQLARAQQWGPVANGVGEGAEAQPHHALRSSGRRGAGPHPGASSGSQQQAQQPQQGDVLELVEAPRHLARITCGAGRIGAGCISPSGSFVACTAGGSGAVRLFRLGTQGEGSAPGQAGGNQGEGTPVGDLGLVSVSRVKLVGQGSNEAQPTALVLTDQYLIVARSDASMSAFALPGTAAAARAHAGSVDGSTSPGGSPLEVNGAGEGHAVQVARLSARDAAGSAHVHPQAVMSVSKAAAAGAGEGKAGSSAWKAFCPAVSVLAASPDGMLIAAAGAAGVSLIRLSEDAGDTALSYAGKLLKSGQDAPVTSLTFSPDGAELAVTLASGHLAVYDAEAGRPTAWTLEHGAAVAACLARLPGAPTGCSYSSEPASRQLLVWSHGGLCSLNTAQPVAGGEEGGKARRRGRSRPEGAPAVTGGTGVTGPVADVASGLGVAAGASSGSAAVTKSAMAAAAAAAERGGNGRAILLADPAAFVGYIGAGEAVLLEKPWDEVMAGFRAPLYRHRYGA